ncbi:MAG: hypothetical protein IJ640_12405 [Prevotella sp.]|nr:hypothetical protein [Prevotella sp.]
MWPNNITASDWISTTTATANAYTYTYRPSVWQDNGGYGVTFAPEQYYYEVSPDVLSRIASAPASQYLSGLAEICIESEQPVEQELEPCTDEELEEFLTGE